MKANEHIQPRVAAGDAGRLLTVTLLWCLMGLLLPRATLYGEMAPFGIGLAAAITTGRLPVTGALMVGYLLAEPVFFPFRYVITVAVVTGARWVVAALPELDEKPIVPPALSFIATAATGLVLFGETGLDGWRILLILAESVVTAGSTLFFGGAIRLSRRLTGEEPEAPVTSGQQACVLFTVAVAAMAGATVTIGAFSPGRAVVAVLVLALARDRQEAGGCMAGCMLGAAVALTTSGYATCAVALALGGLLAGYFAPFGRAVMGAVFLITAGVITLGDAGKQMIWFLCELAVGAGVFLLLPSKAGVRLAQLFLRHREPDAARGARRLAGMRLRKAAGAMTQVGDTLMEVSARLTKAGADSPATIYKNSSRTVCEGCPLFLLCWEQHREDMWNGLEALTPLLYKQGSISEEDLVGYVAGHCRRPDRLVDYINRSFEQHIAREGAWGRLKDLQNTLQAQLVGTGEMLGRLAEELETATTVDEEMAARILNLCRDHGISASRVLCTREETGRITVAIQAADGGLPEEGRWRQELHRLCGRPLTASTVCPIGEEWLFTFTEKPRYRVESAMAQRCCDGEKLCGDAADILPLERGIAVLISDGMGSGGRAAVDGALTVGITGKLWQAGLHPNSILHILSAALLVKSREESLATWDVLTVDTFTGRLDSYKAGAAPSLLCSGGRVSRLDRPSLPLGILPEVTAEHSHDRLAPGDIVLLLSDGAIPEGVAPVELLLQNHPADAPLQALVDQVVAAAADTKDGGLDDITAVAVRLLRCEET